MFHLLHQLIKIPLTEAGTSKANLIIKLVLKVLPIGYTCRTTFHLLDMPLLWYKRHISSQAKV